MLQSRATWAYRGGRRGPQPQTEAEQKKRKEFITKNRSETKCWQNAPRHKRKMQAKLFFGCALKQETDAWTRHYRRRWRWRGMMRPEDRQEDGRKRRKSAKCTRSRERRINSWQSLPPPLYPLFIVHCHHLKCCIANGGCGVLGGNVPQDTGLATSSRSRSRSSIGKNRITELCRARVLSCGLQEKYDRLCWDLAYD